MIKEKLKKVPGDSSRLEGGGGSSTEAPPTAILTLIYFPVAFQTINIHKKNNFKNNKNKNKNLHKFLESL